MLWRNGADLEALERRGYSALILAAKEGHDSIVRDLIKHRVDLESLSYSQSSALHFASYYNRINVVKDLIRAGANVNVNTLLNILK